MLFGCDGGDERSLHSHRLQGSRFSLSKRSAASESDFFFDECFRFIGCDESGKMSLKCAWSILMPDTLAKTA